ncbi:MAG: hypothetical protein DRI74_07380 [Bacteroidetes bacterium]|nr:MAG: hypothetical protein DRI74_07380 [Bacteroidota bacterium]
MTRFYFLLLLIFISSQALAGSRIYLIRHATVDIKKPGWCSAKVARDYKAVYDTALIQTFNPRLVLDKIDHSDGIDTVFCSPQFRAIQTVDILFDKNVIRKTDVNLMEFDYPVSRIPLIRLPLKAWLVCC